MTKEQNTIDRLIRTYEPDERTGPAISAELKRFAQRFGGLPVLWDGGGCFLLRPDLTIWSVAWGRSEVEKLEDPRFRNTVLYRASREFEALRSLKPVRDSDSRVCPMCQGTGTVPNMPPELDESIVCYCGGLGWVPADS
jgi:hypothetical protein